MTYRGGMGREVGWRFKRKGIYIYIPMVDSWWCMAEINTMLWNNYPSIKNTVKKETNGTTPRLERIQLAQCFFTLLLTVKIVTYMSYLLHLPAFIRLCCGKKKKLPLNLVACFIYHLWSILAVDWLWLSSMCLLHSRFQTANKDMPFPSSLPSTTFSARGCNLVNSSRQALFHLFSPVKQIHSS